MTTLPFSRKDITLANWREPPFHIWSFANVSEFVPTAVISSGTEDGGDSPGTGPLEGMMLTAPDGTRISATDHLARSHGDCFVAMRDDHILAEWNAPHGSTVRPHLIFSISKSVTGMLAGIAVGEGKLDPAAPVSRYVGVRPGSAYETATVRDLLDMTVSLDFVEDYLDHEGDFDRYRRSMLWNPERQGTTPETMEQVLVSLPRLPGPHGKVFAYASPNTDMLGIVIERATGIRLHDYLRERLWHPMGARGPAYVSVDRVGAARAAGGMCVTARDLARLGQLVLDGGRRGGRQIIPADWVDDMRRNGDRQAWIDGNFATSFPQGRYRSCWYQIGSERDHFAGEGIHGQRLLVDPVSRVVIVKFSTVPLPSDEAATVLDFAMLSQIAAAL
ncbi:MAG: serine hydrolase [Mesorhizobium sp.]|nr:serine hydrolase [Mesorhizobium sp.]